MNDVTVLDWYGLYSDGWQGEIVPQAFSHPAKFARGLIRAIYAHAIERGYLRPGDSVVDCFGGVALGGLDAMLNGLHWTGVELEPRFADIATGLDCPGFTKADWKRFYGRANRVNHRHGFRWCPVCESALNSANDMRRELDTPLFSRYVFSVTSQREIPCRPPHHYQGNIELWQSRYGGRLRNFGTARILQGDSRNLAALVAEAGAFVSSPPYAGCDLGQRDQRTGGQRLEAMRRAHESGAVMGDEALRILRNGLNQNHNFNTSGGYGSTPGQLGSMREGAFDAAVSSPPFSGDKDLMPINHQGVRSDMVASGRQPESQTQQTPGNLAMLRADEEGFEAVTSPTPYFTPSFTSLISSPPYADSLSTVKQDVDDKLEAAKQSGATAARATWGANKGSAGWSGDIYGTSGGQLGNMKDSGFTAAISSPPYADAVKTGEGPGARHDPIHHNGDNAYKSSSSPEYGRTPGNLGNMTGEGFDAVASSPPFESSLAGDLPEVRGGGVYTAAERKDGDSLRLGSSLKNTYNIDSAANIGNDQGETFWTAARQIVEQVHTVLKPGGYAIWVCKRFVRNKQIVEFSEQWAQLCEAAGFERVEWVRAWLIEDRGTQLDIFGNGHDKSIKRSSFFRKLYEKKYPENSIDWEDVIIMRRCD